MREDQLFHNELTLKHQCITVKNGFKGSTSTMEGSGKRKVIAKPYRYQVC